MYTVYLYVTTMWWAGIVAVRILGIHQTFDTISTLFTHWQLWLDTIRFRMMPFGTSVKWHHTRSLNWLVLEWLGLGLSFQMWLTKAQQCVANHRTPHHILLPPCHIWALVSEHFLMPVESGIFGRFATRFAKPILESWYLGILWEIPSSQMIKDQLWLVVMCQTSRASDKSTWEDQGTWANQTANILGQYIPGSCGCGRANWTAVI